MTAHDVQTGVDGDRSYNGDVPPTNHTATPYFTDITVRHMRGDTAGAAVFVRGLPESIVHLKLQDVLLSSPIANFTCADASCELQNVQTT